MKTRNTARCRIDNLIDVIYRPCPGHGLFIESDAGLMRSGTHRNYSCRLSVSAFECSLFSADKYALADATTISRSAPTPLTMRPAFDRRMVTSPCDWVPVVIALTENSNSSAPLAVFDSIALTIASTG